MNPLNLIFPADLYCISCGRPLPLQEPVSAEFNRKGQDPISLCKDCADEIVWATGRCCAKCGRPLAGENPSKLCRECAASGENIYRKGYACALYAGRVAELVRDMKYHEKPWYANTVAALMAARLASEISSVSGDVICYDYIAAVPMTAAKRGKRGYDQAALIAKGLSRRIRVPYPGNTLVRVRDTDVMSALSADERRQNLAGAFAVSCDMLVSGKRFLLADDVYTTGSSVNACAEALLDAGAECVDVVVFAIGSDIGHSEGDGS